MKRKKPASNVGDKLDLKVNLELIVVAATRNGAPCRILNLDRGVILRADGDYDLIPGEIAVVKAHRQRMSEGRLYVYGKVLSTRLDVNALELTPLDLEDVANGSPHPTSAIST